MTDSNDFSTVTDERLAQNVLLAALEWQEAVDLVVANAPLPDHHPSAQGIVQRATECHMTLLLLARELRRRTQPDIVLTPHPHHMICPTCGLSRYLPDGWQQMLGSDTLTCTKCDEVMLELPNV